MASNHTNLKPKSLSPYRAAFTPGFGLFLLALFICASVGFYFAYTSNISGTPDFFVEWTATRVSLEGGNPYSRATTELIQLGSKGRLVGSDEDQLAYATPFWRIFFSVPIAYIPYPYASAIWLGFMLALYIAAIHLSMRVAGWQPDTPVNGVIIYLVLILNFPSFSSLMLGQSALLAAAFLGGAYYCMKIEATALAGVFLALSTTKPQCVVGVVVFLGFYALWRLDWKFILGFGITMLLLIVPSFIVYPDWLNQFLQGVGRYGSYKKSLTGPGFIFEWLGSLATVPVIITFALLVGIGLFVFWQVLGLPRPKAVKVPAHPYFDFAFSVMVILTLLLPPQTNISNAVVLFIPITLVLCRWQGTPGFYILAFSALVLSWLFYFGLYNNAYGALIVLPPLLTGALVLYAYRSLFIPKKLDSYASANNSHLVSTQSEAEISSPKMAEGTHDAN